MPAFTGSRRLSYSPRKRTYAIASSGRSCATCAIVPLALMVACSASTAAILARSSFVGSSKAPCHQSSSASSSGAGRFSAGRPTR